MSIRPIYLEPANFLSQIPSQSSKKLSKVEKWFALAASSLFGTPAILKIIEKATHITLNRPQYFFISLAAFGFASTVKLLISLHQPSKSKKPSPRPEIAVTVEKSKQIKALEAKNEKLHKEKNGANKRYEAMKNQRDEAKSIHKKYRARAEKSIETLMETRKNLRQALKDITAELEKKPNSPSEKSSDKKLAKENEQLKKKIKQLELSLQTLRSEPQKKKKKARSLKAKHVKTAPI